RVADAEQVRVADAEQVRVADAERRPSGEDAAARALEHLWAEIDLCIGELERARDRAGRLLEQRASGRQWLDIVTTESRPLVVESISTVLSSLATAGHAWRRDQAAALQAEGVSINRIAALFGVTRQRISALLREQGATGADTGEEDAAEAPAAPSL
ncbi:hypothetical protein OF117_13300, partial [Geodermatophilus sp. YIM 151500]|uniref:hypothetical protein n=1 Tax=Geodermatophilus sp. YIM 151500 TaxID=2984531 RepID=UPI0021E37911